MSSSTRLDIPTADAEDHRSSRSGTHPEARRQAAPSSVCKLPPYSLDVAGLPYTAPYQLQPPWLPQGVILALTNHGLLETLLTITAESEEPDSEPRLTLPGMNPICRELVECSMQQPISESRTCQALFSPN
ncbi:hypothetical protein DICSQDRAFT_136284 [Dichomitus squalens LYAD-421 SS1]|uniref:Uncharacterized protein n=1 Tax=Dichomitus squalens (strain LYAD-421) TaxID=732165 RepID=R7T1D1_DICSQ|nr:uncharacterized protein DICSQDRAFT_136284 [Dichomitus squalens LYAD-421 SS1]EJF61770.1 hypothetical protein DICSQDRAFT_136284 [Dichomitus squalens LYAD-421 SS1]